MRFGVLGLLAVLADGCGSGSSSSSAPTLADAQAAFAAGLAERATATQLLDPTLPTARAYELTSVTVTRFVTPPMQHPGEPGWTAELAASGTYRVEREVGSTMQSAEAEKARFSAQTTKNIPGAPGGRPNGMAMAAPPTALPPRLSALPETKPVPSAPVPGGAATTATSAAVSSTTLTFRRSFPIRLERDAGGGWHLPK